MDENPISILQSASAMTGIHYGTLIDMKKDEYEINSFNVVWALNSDADVYQEKLLLLLLINDMAVRRLTFLCVPKRYEVQLYTSIIVHPVKDG